MDTLRVTTLCVESFCVLSCSVHASLEVLADCLARPYGMMAYRLIQMMKVVEESLRNSLLS